MSATNRALLAERIGEYVAETNRGAIVVVFHGGEPLLAGAEALADLAREIRAAVPIAIEISFAMQTNGLLLNVEALDALAQADITVSLSIDGPMEAHDLHRLTPAGKSSFAGTLNALELLESRPETYAGLIAVVDPRVLPQDLFTFFAEHRPPRVDFLLPDANHLRPPPGREDDADLYVRWLLTAFDLWFDHYPWLRVRSFEAVINGLVGLPSETDSFGLGDVSLVTIETDGSYHDLDVFKITRSGTAIGGNVEDTSIAEIAVSSKLAEHRALLRLDGLAAECQLCPEVNICGGGSVPHRYSTDGFKHPTVYCREMLALIGHARKRVHEQLNTDIETSLARRTAESPEVDVANFDAAGSAAPIVAALCQHWKREAVAALHLVLSRAVDVGGNIGVAASRLLSLPQHTLAELSIQPSTVAWVDVMTRSHAGRDVTSLSGKKIPPDMAYIETLACDVEILTGSGLRVHRPDTWLRLPFEDERLLFDDEALVHGAGLVNDAVALIAPWQPELMNEMNELSREILFIRDLTAHPDKCVSFSDDAVPGALYCSIRSRDGFISAYDLADSLIHEHRHQKLYLLDRAVPLVANDSPRVISPWREDPRPPSGLLHAVFVFVELLAFWRQVDTKEAEIADRARSEVESTTERLRRGFGTLRNVELTTAGVALLDNLETRARLR